MEALRAVARSPSSSASDSREPGRPRWVAARVRPPESGGWALRDVGRMPSRSSCPRTQSRKASAPLVPRARARSAAARSRSWSASGSRQLRAERPRTGPRTRRKRRRRGDLGCRTERRRASRHYSKASLIAANIAARRDRVLGRDDRKVFAQFPSWPIWRGGVVTIDEIVAASRSGFSRVAPRRPPAGLVVLAAADGLVDDPQRLGGVRLREDGGIELERSSRANEGDAEATLRSALRALLGPASTRPSPSCARVSGTTESRGLRRLIVELEAALIPVNRSAGSARWRASIATSAGRVGRAGYSSTRWTRLEPR